MHSASRLREGQPGPGQVAGDRRWAVTGAVRMFRPRRSQAPPRNNMPSLPRKLLRGTHNLKDRVRSFPQFPENFPDAASVSDSQGDKGDSLTCYNRATKSGIAGIGETREEILSVHLSYAKRAVAFVICHVSYNVCRCKLCTTTKIV